LSFPEVLRNAANSTCKHRKYTLLHSNTFAPLALCAELIGARIQAWRFTEGTLFTAVEEVLWEECVEDVASFP
jgi:hypothetical protein